MQQIAFVCGVPRSGTTAMAQLLNGHPLVCMGIERYRSAFRDRDFSPAFFEKERFFNFDASQRGYRTMAEKWEKARIIGDKLPALFGVLPQIRERFPSVKIVYMLRDVHPVACSWNRRALNEADTWAKDQTFRPAVLLWNRANRIIAEQVREGPKDILIVCYERVFSGDESELARLCDFLGVGQDPALTAEYWRRIEHYRSEVAPKPALVLPGQEEFIRHHADMRLYQALRDGKPVRWHHLLRRQKISGRKTGLLRCLYNRLTPTPAR